MRDVSTLCQCKTVLPSARLHLPDVRVVQICRLVSVRHSLESTRSSCSRSWNTLPTSRICCFIPGVSSSACWVRPCVHGLRVVLPAVLHATATARSCGRAFTQWYALVARIFACDQSLPLWPIHLAIWSDRYLTRGASVVAPVSGPMYAGSGQATRPARWETALPRRTATLQALLTAPGWWL